MWFSTASIITRCCCEGSGTCILLAPPIAGCGTSPSPPISLLVSMMTTRLCNSSLSTLAISRITVVLPTPGLPKKRIELGESTISRIMSTCPVTALPTRQVRPTIAPRRLRIAEIRCSVPSTPARLSPPKSPSADAACSKSSCVITSSRRYSPPFFPPKKRASGRRPRSNTTSSSSERCGWQATCLLIFSGSTHSNESRSSRTITEPS
mmetsp:Transcript_4807/g.13885  ORF Transcript_4807/g.13885 Transcript_4807/m.13885 type:complete len:208 (+) Transcript_4807:1659-2282(+)